MADNDLIRRGDALELVLKLSADDNASWGMIMEDLRALPAAEVAPNDPATVVEWPEYVVSGVCETLDCRPSNAKRLLTLAAAAFAEIEDMNHG